MGLFNTNVLAYGKYSEEYMIMLITKIKVAKTTDLKIHN